MSVPGPVPALALRHVEKSFPGVKALQDVSIEVRPHEVVGLVGHFTILRRARSTESATAMMIMMPWTICWT